MGQPPALDESAPDRDTVEKDLRRQRKEWNDRWTSLRIVYRWKHAEFRSTNPQVRPSMPVGTVHEVECRYRKDGWAFEHDFVVDASGRTLSRNVTLVQPDKLYKVSYPAADSRFENPEEVHTAELLPASVNDIYKCFPYCRPLQHERVFAVDEVTVPRNAEVAQESAGGLRIWRVVITGGTSPVARNSGSSTWYATDRNCLTHKTEYHAIRNTVDDFREVAPGWWFPWKGRDTIGPDNHQTVSTITWEVLKAELNPQFGPQDFELPFGPDTVETTGNDHRPLTLPSGDGKRHPAHRRFSPPSPNPLKDPRTLFFAAALAALGGAYFLSQNRHRTAGHSLERTDQEPFS